MIAVMVLAVLAVLAVLVGAFVLGVVLTGTAVRGAQERLRIRRQAQEASWRIHCQAADAFDQMLRAARETDREGRL